MFSSLSWSKSSSIYGFVSSFELNGLSPIIFSNNILFHLYLGCVMDGFYGEIFGLL